MCGAVQVIAVVPDSAEACSADASIPEAAILQEKAAAVGGCKCKTGCATAMCRSCTANSRPCTIRCTCKGMPGACKNPHNSSVRLPEGVTAAQLQELTLQQIVPKLTAADLLDWAGRHGRFAFYWAQFKLCAVEEDCWYCNKLDAERGGPRLVPRWTHLPLYSCAKPDGSWESLTERVAKLADAATRQQAEQVYMTDEALPSTIIARAFVTACQPQQPTDVLVSELAAKTLLQPHSIREIWSQLYQKHKRQLARQQQQAAGGGAVARGQQQQAAGGAAGAPGAAASGSTVLQQQAAGGAAGAPGQQQVAAAGTGAAWQPQGVLHQTRVLQQAARAAGSAVLPRQQHAPSGGFLSLLQDQEPIQQQSRVATAPGEGSNQQQHCQQGPQQQHEQLEEPPASLGLDYDAVFQLGKYAAAEYPEPPMPLQEDGLEGLGDGDGYEVLVFPWEGGTEVAPELLHGLRLAEDAS